MVLQRKAPKQARAKQRVAKLLEAAERLLIEEGYHSFTTNKVAERSEISIASLYQYFPNKESLIYAINRKMLDEVVNDFERYLELSKTLTVIELFDLMDSEYLVDNDHIKLVRELDHAIYTNQDLQKMEDEHCQRVAEFYAQLLEFYGSTWPRHSLLNLGRTLYSAFNDITYFREYPTEADKIESIKLYKITNQALLDKAMTTDGI